MIIWYEPRRSGKSIRLVQEAIKNDAIIITWCDSMADWMRSMGAPRVETTKDAYLSEVLFYLRGLSNPIYVDEVSRVVGDKRTSLSSLDEMIDIFRAQIGWLPEIVTIGYE